MIEIKSYIDVNEYDSNRKVNLIERIKRYFNRRRWAKQRAKYSVCEWDLWDGSDYYIANVLRNYITFYAENHYCYPGVEPFETEEKWQTYVEELRDLLDQYVQFCYDDGKSYDITEYDKEYYKQQDNLKKAFNMFIENCKYIQD